MKTRVAFGKSLREIRRAQGLTQEDFSDVSSRTYISLLERGGTSPTLEKVESIARALKVHPLTLLTLTYLRADARRSLNDIAKTIAFELKVLEK